MKDKPSISPWLSLAKTAHNSYCILFLTSETDAALEEILSHGHPAESSENTSICAKIRKYVPIDCLWRMFL